MPTIQRYLVAKYVPDIRRMEPVNIGVVLWSNGSVASKFLGLDDASFVTDKKTYLRWMDYWQSLLSDSSIRPKRGTPIAKESPAFLDEFAKTQGGSYLLLDGGEVISKVAKRKLDGAADFLFDQIVSRKGIPWPTDRKAQGTQLRVVADRLFHDIGLADHEDFQPKYPVTCTVGKRTKTVPVHYAIANGTLKSVFQRVNLSQFSSVGYATFLFEHGLGSLEKNRRVAIVRSGEAAALTDEIESSIDLLNESATVIDVTDYNAAKRLLGEILHQTSA